MDVDNLQSYLNWFVYLLRCQRDNNKWKKKRTNSTPFVTRKD